MHPSPAAPIQEVDAGRYTLVPDRTRGLLRVTLSGFFSIDTVRRFAADRRVAIAQLGLPSNSHDVLCDVSDCRIHTAETADAFRKAMADPALISRRLAFVTGSALSWMQAKRVLGSRGNVVWFDKPDDAERWLREP